MFEPIKSVASGFALAGAAAMPALADTEPATAAPSSAVSSQIVVRDAATGRLRAPTAEEARELQPRADAVRDAASARTLPRVHASGARGARLSDAFMNYSVMVRQPDGSLVEQCFGSREEAESALKAGGVAKSTTLPTE